MPDVLHPAADGDNDDDFGGIKGGMRMNLMSLVEFQRLTFACTWRVTPHPSQAAYEQADRRSAEWLSTAPHYTPLELDRGEPHSHVEQTAAHMVLREVVDAPRL